MQIRATDNLDRAIEFLANIEAAFGIDEMLDKMREILEFEHKEMFDRGYRTADQPWQDTDEFWRRRLKGKGGKGPLVWTGEAERSIRADVRGRAVEVSGAAYLGKFDPAVRQASGVSATFSEAFPVEITGEGPNDFIKLSDIDAADDIKVKRITVKDRHVFDVTMDDVSQMMHDLAAAANLELGL